MIVQVIYVGAPCAIVGTIKQTGLDLCNATGADSYRIVPAETTSFQKSWRNIESSYIVCVDNFEDLDRELEAAKARGALTLIEAKCSIGARADLGRPTTTALENKQNFMDYLKTR